MFLLGECDEASENRVRDRKIYCRQWLLWSWHELRNVFLSSICR